MNTFKVIKYGLGLIVNGYRQSALINKWLKPLIQKHCNALQYSLSDSEKNKVFFYYPMYTVLLNAQVYIMLKNRQLTIEETKRVTLVGAMITLCDDLIDEDNFTLEELFMLLSEDLQHHQIGEKAKLLVALNNELKKIWNIPDAYMVQLKKSIEWQIKSNRQREPDISIEEIVVISKEKSGQTTLLISKLLDAEWTEMENTIIYQSGIISQLTNDSFDLYKDIQNSFFTYFNKAESIADAYDFFMNECRLLHKLVRDTTISKKLQGSMISRMSILHGFTLTALDQFAITEKKYGSTVNWKDIPRKEVIIDMAKNANRFKTIRNIKWLSKQ